MLVGEIGISRRDFLYGIRFWEARRLLRGYNRRHRDMWSAMRWHAFNIMSAMPYTDLQKAGITKPSDLIQFPWDKAIVTEADIPTDEEVEETVQMLQQMNSKKE